MATAAAVALEFIEPASGAPIPQRKEPFDSSVYLNDGKFHILLAASGSVATIKIPDIIKTFSERLKDRISIRLILTASAANFLQGQAEEQPSLSDIGNIEELDGIYFDHDEWDIPWTRGAKILHIELRRWADVMLIAPLSANTLAKMVNGFSDNLLLSTIRAWDTTGILDVPHTISLTEGQSVTYPSPERKKKILVAPAMNTAMWVHPITEKQIKVLDEEWGVKSGGWTEVLSPIQKELACGDVGPGAMLSWEKIVERTLEVLEKGS